MTPRQRAESDLDAENRHMDEDELTEAMKTHAHNVIALDDALAKIIGACGDLGEMHLGGKEPMLSLDRWAAIKRVVEIARKARLGGAA